MIYIYTGLLGIIFGSFINALVWRVHEQAKESSKKKPNQKYLERISITRGHSICPDCKHQLGPLDLVPVFSYLFLGGKCRYCRKHISIQYPVIEILTAALFVLSYLCWPSNLSLHKWLLIPIWLAILIGLVALMVYDYKWMLLPNRILYPITFLALVFAAIRIATYPHVVSHLVNTALSVLIGSGLFYLIFQISDGKWIGGGDVKLGFCLGLFLGSAFNAFTMIFLASLIGSLFSIPLLASKKLKTRSMIPFGPLLIIASIIVLLFGQHLLNLYNQMVV